ncbi:hypothetical protein [Microcella sp.]|uniref:hypothetical protein n=1 Tax=Microcella sp. TaxID=1913979 RepID=UPI00391D8204
MTRLLDFGTPDRFSGIFGRPRTLAWPVDAYRVTIPKPPGRGDGLNPFERVVLGVLQAEQAMSIENIADTTCIPADLVRSVLLRLHDRGLVDRDRRPTSDAAQSTRGLTEETRYVTAMVFRDAISGQLLPYVHQLDGRSGLSYKEHKKGEVTEIRPGRGVRSSPSPDSKMVISAIRQARSRAASDTNSFHLPMASQIRVASEPEQHLLECRIAILRSDAEFRIANPFGNGFSLALEESMSQLLGADERLQGWMTNWRDSLMSSDRKADSGGRPLEPYEEGAIRRRYPNLVNSLTPDRKLHVRSTKKIYDSLEWALFYCTDARSAKIAVEVLRQTAAADWSSTLSMAAEKIGLATPKYGFRAIPSGRLTDFLDGKAEMATTSAIALTQAALDVEHPLRAVAERFPGLLLTIQEIKEIRDSSAHGDAAATAVGESRFDPFLRECVSLLLPDVRFDSSSIAPRSKSSLDEERFEARTALLGALGYRLLNQLNMAAQNALLDAEHHWRFHEDDEDAMPMISALNASLQAVSRELLVTAANPGLAEREYLQTVAEAARAAGLGELPPTLATVRPERVREALQGNGSTLGACLVAYLITAGPERLVQLAEQQPALLQDLGEVLARRGHGNEAAPMSKAEAGRLRRATLRSIRTLLEA